ncbi:MAG: hypothetical protein ABIH72_00425 [archaeon]
MIQINISNKFLYTLLAGLFLVSISLAVYAIDTSQPYHSAEQIDTSNGFTVEGDLNVEGGASVGGSSICTMQSGCGSAPGAIIGGGSTRFGCPGTIPLWGDGKCSGSTFYCETGIKIKTGAIDFIAGNPVEFVYLCFSADPNENTVYIGVDNNGVDDPDCWFESGPGITSCGATQWGTPGHERIDELPQECVNGALTRYNTLNIDGKTGGWSVKSWSDTGAASSCVDGTSDKLEIHFLRISS